MRWIIDLISSLFRAWFGVKQADQTARETGVSQANAQASKEAAKIAEAVTQATVDAPKTRSEVSSKLRRGEF